MSQWKYFPASLPDPLELLRGARGLRPERTGTELFVSANTSRRRAGGSPRFTGPAYGALDLGTNNCRLLIARPTGAGFKVIDSFSQIVRLGEGLGHSNRLSDAAMARTIEALKTCTEKLGRRNVQRCRLVATEACRSAQNGADFIERVYKDTGLRLEVIDRETEAWLAAAGSAALIKPDSERALIFDIGGGSSELMWLARGPQGYVIDHWTSVPIGVVTLAERFGGHDVTKASFEAMVASLAPHFFEFNERAGLHKAFNSPKAHMLGTSGTVTTLAGLSLKLEYYDRNKVDGHWLSDDDIHQVTGELMGLSYDERAASPCIGVERTDLVLAGCAILRAILDQWPCSRVRVADRGLREGILTSLMESDGHASSHPMAQILPLKEKAGRGDHTNGRAIQ